MRARQLCMFAAWMAGSACHTTGQATPLDHVAQDPEDCRALLQPAHNALWQSYARAPDTHPNLPNVGYAGYRYGAALPDTTAMTRVDVTDYGAREDGSADASDAVDAALDVVSSEGGVVYFPAGTYRLSRPIVVQSDHVVIEGDGAEETRLLFTHALNDSYATNTDALGKSRWSWTGGMIWLSPRHDRRRAVAGDISAQWDEGWTALDTQLPIVGDYKRGDMTLRVDDTSSLRPAQLVLIEVDASAALHKHLSGDGAFADAQDWSETGAGAILPPRKASVTWPVSIVSIDGDQITLRQPLRFDLRADWSPRVRAVREVITESGVRDLSIVLARQRSYDPKKDHNHEVGWNGLLFENALHCFADNVRVVDSESAIAVVASKNVTVRAFTITASDAARARQHHGTIARLASNDVLFEDFAITAQPLHGLNVEGLSMGNVWSRGRVDHGTWDLHRALPVENVLTELVIHNDGQAGGNIDAGPRAGARHAVWNVRVQNNDCRVFGDPGLLPSGAIVGLRGCTLSQANDSGCLVIDSGNNAATPSPPNLHAAQRDLIRCAHMD